jgi:tetratricopeptide (TPR) repeat protein
VLNEMIVDTTSCETEAGEYTRYTTSAATSGGLGRRYYRLALSAAARRDLRSAVLYARYASTLDPGQANAVKLLDLCRYELGEGGGTEDEGLEKEDLGKEDLGKVRLLAAEKKWREAARTARAVRRQSVRVLNIQGCLWALAKDYTNAADCFAQTLGKDRLNPLAAEGLAELTRKQKPFGNILRKFVRMFE